MQKTPLYEVHKNLGGKLVPFAGWELPVQYQGVIQEHTATRTQAGLFDVSHMGEIVIDGLDAEKFLQYVTCNDVSKIEKGKAQYNAFLNENGGVVDDIIVYKRGSENFFVCVNAANTEKDFTWLNAQLKNFPSKNFTLKNLSDQYGQIALQGPQTFKILENIPELRTLSELPYFGFSELQYHGFSLLAARTGYTGEDGIEFFIPWNETVSFWKLLLEVGGNYGLVPCGLGARDSLRLEACYPLHGHELSDEVSALESGLSWIVKFEKGDFIGKNALLSLKEKGLPRILRGFIITDPGIVREHTHIFSKDGVEIGITTSGTKTPTVGKALGLMLIQKDQSAYGNEIFFEVRGKKLKGYVEKTPFYKHPLSK